MAMPSLVSTDKDDHTAILTLDRPRKYNAMSEKLLQDLERCFDAAESDPEVRSIIITGSGDKAFVAGGDLGDINKMTIYEARRYILTGQRVFGKIESSDKIVIAALNGYTLGGGMELALTCDLRIASERAVLGLPETALGLYPAWGGIHKLARIIGLGLAKEFILTGDRIPLERAYQVGLVNNVVKHDSLLDVCKELAGKMNAASLESAIQAKRALNRVFDYMPSELMNYDLEAFLKTFDTKERKDRLTAFVEKRKREHD